MTTFAAAKVMVWFADHDDFGQRIGAAQ